MNTISKMIHVSVLALCVLAPGIGHAEDKFSLKKECTLQAQGRNQIHYLGAYGDTAGVHLRLRKQSTVTANSYRTKFFARFYNWDPSLGWTIKLMQMQGGACVVRQNDELNTSIRLGNCSSPEAEWIALPVGTGQFFFRSRTSPSRGIGVNSVAVDTIPRMVTLDANNHNHIWDFIGCINMANEYDDPT
jgi:hypothetical protein